MTDKSKRTLWHDLPEGAVYPTNDKWHSHLLDQYKLYVEMADRISQRRTSANSYFLSVNSAILAFAGYLTSKGSTDYLWLMAVAGILLCVLWHNIITAYRNLNTAKWEVVQQIEERLPISPYAAEWDAVERGRNPKLYRPLSHIERFVPWIFAGLQVIVLAKSFPWGGMVSWIRATIG